MYVSIQRYRIREFVTLGEKEKMKYKNKYILEMSFQKLPRQFQEEMIFPGQNSDMKK